MRATAAGLLTLRPETAGQASLVSSDAPWSVVDLRRALRSLALGTALVVGGYVGASGTPLISRQLSWAAVAVVGVLVGGSGLVTWLLAATRAVSQLTWETVTAVDTRAVVEAAEQVTAAPDAAGLGFRPDQLVTAPGMTRYHRPECLFARRKALVAVTAAGCDGLEPCGVCQP